MTLPLDIYDRSALLALLMRCQNGEASCLFTLNAIEDAADRKLKLHETALIEAERVLALAYDLIESDENDLSRQAIHVNASIRAVLARVRPLLTKSHAS